MTKGREHETHVELLPSLEIDQVDLALTTDTATFLAVQDSSISDIVCLSLGLSEPTNNQSLEIRIAMETNTKVVKVRNTLDKTFA